ncbi:recombinase family protein [Bradyrhizobium canariense]|uniref:recombinase family protein n=1 Tax=Bradyrhizobium canariense TaxID=255045 RepID=UPI000A198E1C|nr:recombinase family protein [Bradyrhizobium canariense]OSI24346.1 resolvase [Bradyrhizobium canariense]OSI29639.1 resolvase [Bradyrhizobium canariense]OSI46470.1 resolvase [Bradyrhizobium canariense]OSI53909.1 resolvase [Bradyrhizobium canariense]OSI56859.1 resolvase [Bradyrhizobium canariense]
MAEGVFVAYYRVSTKGQGRSGLGLDAQRETVRNYLNDGQSSLVEAFTEVESGKRDDDRPQLAKALQTCRAYGAKLVIAKLDRLSRDAHFLLGLEKAGVDFVAADMPHANRLTVGIMAMVADEERRAISQRTKAALAAAKRRGVELGGDRGARLSGSARKAGRDAQTTRAIERAADLAPIIRDLQAGGVTSLSGVAKALTKCRVPTPRGLGRWSAVQVARTLARITVS